MIKKLKKAKIRVRDESRAGADVGASRRHESGANSRCRLCGKCGRERPAQR